MQFDLLHNIPRLALPTVTSLKCPWFREVSLENKFKKKEKKTPSSHWKELFLPIFGIHIYITQIQIQKAVKCHMRPISAGKTQVLSVIFPLADYPFNHHTQNIHLRLVVTDQ